MAIVTDYHHCCNSTGLAYNGCEDLLLEGAESILPSDMKLCCHVGSESVDCGCLGCDSIVSSCRWLPIFWRTVSPPSFRAERGRVHMCVCVCVCARARLCVRAGEWVFQVS
jgi:hypothetical protein